MDKEAKDLLVDIFKNLGIGIFSTLIASLIIWMIVKMILKYKFKVDEVNGSSEVVVEDLIGRNEVADNILKSINKLNVGGSSRFAIRGGYGYGKSFVIKRIEETCKKNGHPTIAFAAWEKDEYYTPTERLLISLVNIAEKINLPDKEKKMLKRIIQKDSNLINMPFASWSKKYDALKRILTNINVDTKEKKLYIMIDELDRCTNNDAIEFLEITNQMFGNNENVIVIYSWDLEALKQIIKHNSGIEAPKYINKFIDMEFELENAGLIYFKKVIKENKCDKRNLAWLAKVDFDSLFRGTLRDVNAFLVWVRFASSKINDDVLFNLMILQRFTEKLTVANKTDEENNAKFISALNLAVSETHNNEINELHRIREVSLLNSIHFWNGSSIIGRDSVYQYICNLMMNDVGESLSSCKSMFIFDLRTFIYVDEVTHNKLREIGRNIVFLSYVEKYFAEDNDMGVIKDYFEAIADKKYIRVAFPEYMSARISPYESRLKQIEKLDKEHRQNVNSAIGTLRKYAEEHKEYKMLNVFIHKLRYQSIYPELKIDYKD